MNVALWVAAITAAVSVAGWVTNHILSSQREVKNQQRAAYLRHTERQLEELYGPLAILVEESAQSFRDLLAALGRNYVFRGDSPLSPDDLETWLFWTENDSLPRNEKIKDLLMSKTHLIEGERIPDSYVKFLDHYNSWQINHLRWQKKGVRYSWHSRINYPHEFEGEILETLRAVKLRHAELIAAIGREGRARTPTGPAA